MKKKDLKSFQTLYKSFYSHLCLYALGLIRDEENILKKITIHDLEKDVMQGINNLPPKCREIFLLSRFELLTYNEISEKLNISVNTVKTHISRALHSLRISLKNYL